jgi:hypothetical protein
MITPDIEQLKREAKAAWETVYYLEGLSRHGSSVTAEYYRALDKAHAAQARYEAAVKEQENE